MHRDTRQVHSRRWRITYIPWHLVRSDRAHPKTSLTKCSWRHQGGMNNNQAPRGLCEKI